MSLCIDEFGKIENYYSDLFDFLKENDIDIELSVEIVKLKDGYAGKFLEVRVNGVSYEEYVSAKYRREQHRKWFEEKWRQEYPKK